MKRELITAAQDEIAEITQKLKSAEARLRIKRNQLAKTIIEDTPDLFGERKSEKPGNLFTPPVDPKAVEKALEPIRAEIAGYNRELDKWNADLARLANMPEMSLFSNEEKAA